MHAATLGTRRCTFTDLTTLSAKARRRAAATSSRHCISNIRISNIRPKGIYRDVAAIELAFLRRTMRAHHLSGVRLKDESEQAATLSH